MTAERHVRPDVTLPDAAVPAKPRPDVASPEAPEPDVLPLGEIPQAIAAGPRGQGSALRPRPLPDVSERGVHTAPVPRVLTIAHLYPELLNLYGDSGNILVLRKRMEWRGIEVRVAEVHVDDTPSFSGVDIAFIGGGSDREQRIVCERLLAVRDELAAFVEDGGVLAAVCGGYQLLGESYLMGNEELPGLSLVDLYTDRGEPRLIGNIAVESRISPRPIVGYENHGGRTHLGPGVEPLGRVLYGHGNDDKNGYEGCLYKNVVGTYVHGPLLPKNPGVADYLIARALERKYGVDRLEPLDDAEELAANEVMYRRLMAGEVKEQ